MTYARLDQNMRSELASIEVDGFFATEKFERYQLLLLGLWQSGLLVYLPAPQHLMEHKI